MSQPVDAAELDAWWPSAADVTRDPDRVAAWIAGHGPEPLSVQLLPLLVLHPDELSYPGLVDTADALEQATAWLAAAQARVTAELDRRPVPGAKPGTQDKQWVREELALAWKTSPTAAADRITLATDLTGRHPGTLDLLERGRITPAQARALAEATRSLDNPVAAQIEQRVLPRAAQQNLTCFKRALTRAVYALDPATATQRRDQAEQDRCIRIRPDHDAMATVWGLLPAEGATLIDTTLDTLARKLGCEHDDRTLAQRRADALISLCTDKLTGTDSFHPGATSGLAPHVQVTVALSTLLAVDQQPGDLTGYGPIPAELARRLAADPSGTWTRLVTDPAGHLVHADTAKYRPPADLTRHIRTRDQTCRFPGCTHQPTTTDLDHTIPHSHGGPTNPHNLETLDTRHHHLKHEAGWHVHGDPEHHLTWTSPAGRRYTTQPAQHPTDHTTDPDPPPY